jgi:hypothetical protein
MKIDIENLERITSNGGLIQNDWGDGETSACIMGALAGRNEAECVSKGWPLWLVEVFEYFNDTAEPENLAAEMLCLGRAAVAFNARKGDPERLFRDFRLQSVLPVSMERISDGDEPWRVSCREAVQWSIDNDGASSPVAAEAAGVAGVAAAAAAAEAAEAAEAAARDRMFNCLVGLMEGDAK